MNFGGEIKIFFNIAYFILFQIIILSAAYYDITSIYNPGAATHLRVVRVVGRRARALALQHRHPCVSLPRYVRTGADACALVRTGAYVRVLTGARYVRVLYRRLLLLYVVLCITCPY